MTDAATETPPRFWRNPVWWRRWSLRLLLAWGLWSLFAWQGLPRLLPDLVSRVVADTLGLQARIGHLAINPLAGSLTVDDVAIRDGQELLVALQRLHIDLSLASLWRGSVSLDAVSLVKPRVNARIDARGQLNLMKLVPPDKDPDDSPSTLRWAIDRFTLRGGTVSFRDERQQPALAISLDASDLALNDLRSYGDRPGGFRLSTRLDNQAEITWSGQADLVKLGSHGKITLRQLDLASLQDKLPLTLPARVAAGTLNLDLPYRAAVVGREPRLDVRGARAWLDGLRVTVPTQPEPVLTLARLALSGIDAAWPAQTVTVHDLALQAPAVFLQRAQDGGLAVQRALASQPARATIASVAAAPAQTAAPAAAAPAAAPPVATPWRVQLAHAGIEAGRLTLEDATLRPAARITLQDIGLDTGPLGWPLPATIPLTLKAGVGEGHVTVTGDVAPELPRLALTVTAEDLPLPLLQPWIGQQAVVELRSGKASAALTLAGQPGEDLQVTGRLGVSGLDIRHESTGGRLLGLRALTIADLQADPVRQRLSIGSVGLDGFYSQVLINPDRQLNLATLQRPGPAAPARAAAPAGTPWQVRVGQTRIRNSAMLFSDLSMQPGFATGIQDLNGTVSGLDSRPGQSATLKLTGRVPPGGDVSISGRVNPLAKVLDLDVALQFKQLELSTLTPYAARFAGYRIDKGKLDMDLGYQITGRALTSRNHVVLRQLRLGDKVDSPDAIGIPLKLALAILRDVDDNIDIDLPITGSLDNPEFAIGPLLWQTFVNLIKRAVAAPFSALASLAGGDGDSLSSVRFATGSSALSEEARGNLGKLVSALRSRPALDLEVRGSSDSEADRLALQTARVEALLASRQAGKALPRVEALEKLLREQAGRAAVNSLRELSMVPDPQGRMVLNGAGFEARLLSALAARQPVPDSELASLARQRADAVVAEITQAGIASERVFVLDAGQSKAADGIVTVPLSVNAR